MEVEGLEVTPILLTRAPIRVCARRSSHAGPLPLDGPTTVMQALSVAGGWNVGANLRQVIIFRRGEDWR